ncbi:MAG: hypothetical protein ACXAB7_03360 [Candidatus Kariarchaeaceae archaeon]
MDKGVVSFEEDGFMSTYKLPLLMMLVIILNILFSNIFYSFLIITNVPILVILYMSSIVCSFLAIYQSPENRNSIKLLGVAFACYSITIGSLVLIDVTYDLFSIDMVILLFIFKEFFKVRRLVG